MKTSQKFITIVAGPNGNEKTSFAKSFLSRNKSTPIFLNPDLIANGISPTNNEQASFQAGRLLLTEIKKRIHAGESFGFESTLSGRTYAKLIEEARLLGFQINIYFISLGSIDLSFQRIKKRVKQGGHNIPRSPSFADIHVVLKTFGISIVPSRTRGIFLTTQEELRN